MIGRSFLKGNRPFQACKRFSRRTVRIGQNGPCNLCIPRGRERKQCHCILSCRTDALIFPPCKRRRSRQSVSCSDVRSGERRRGVGTGRFQSLVQEMYSNIILEIVTPLLTWDVRICEKNLTNSVRILDRDRLAFAELAGVVVEFCESKNISSDL